MRGFNALFATASIEAARIYYNQFQLQQDDLPPDQRLKVGLIYSYGANEAVEDGALDEEGFDTGALDAGRPHVPRGRDPGLQRHVRHQLRHQSPTSSRTTTRTCRCG